jgi:hypothetical protein
VQALSTANPPLGLSNKIPFEVARSLPYWFASVPEPRIEVNSRPPPCEYVCIMHRCVPHASFLLLSVCMLSCVSRLSSWLYMVACIYACTIHIHTYMHTFVQMADDNAPCVRGHRIGVLKHLVLQTFSSGKNGKYAGHASLHTNTHTRTYIYEHIHTQCAWRILFYMRAHRTHW